MNPLDTNSQSVHEMVPVLFFFSFILLLVLSLFGRLVNRVMKRNVVNGAYIALVLLLLLVAVLLGLSLFHPKITLHGSRMLGQGMAALIPATALSFFLGRRFSQKKKPPQEQVLSTKVSVGER